MRRPPRYSPASHLVLEHFVSAPRVWFHGYALTRELDVASGTLYPILMRLAENGWLETRWQLPEKGGHLPRHLYRLAGGAAPEARALLHRWATDPARLPALRHAP
jgi:DNA-binding PadR family transcriptional regulator